MKKIIAALTVLALVSCNKKEETNIQTEENNPVEITEAQESQSSTVNFHIASLNKLVYD